MMRRIGIAVLLLVILVAGWAVYLYWVAGQFKTIEPHFSGKCKSVAGVVGPEDITIHPRTGVAYVSACDRRALQEGEPGSGASPTGSACSSARRAMTCSLSSTIRAGNIASMCST